MTDPACATSNVVMPDRADPLLTVRMVDAHAHVVRTLVSLWSIVLIGSLVGCGFFEKTECREPLSRAQCEAAVADARAFVDAHPDLSEDFVADGDVAAIRYAVVLTCAPEDWTCHRDQPGLGWVQLVDAAGDSPGSIAVCVETLVCASHSPSFVFR